VKAIRAVLLHIHWIVLLDEWYDHGKSHLAQKWGMGSRFPKYADYQLFCGETEKRALEIKRNRELENERIEEMCHE